MLGLLTADVFAVEVSWGHLKEEERDEEQALIIHYACEGVWTRSRVLKEISTRRVTMISTFHSQERSIGAIKYVL